MGTELCGAPEEEEDRKFKKFRLLMTMMVQLYQAIIESNITWFAAAAAKEKAMQQQVMSSAERLMGSPLPSPKSLLDSSAPRRVRRIMGDPSYPGLGLFFLVFLLKECCGCLRP